jgi:hypothetical protein
MRLHPINRDHTHEDRGVELIMRYIAALFSAIALFPSLCCSAVQAEPAKDATERCKALGSADFSQVQDAPAQVIETKAVDRSVDTPGYCQVSGYVTPNVGFLLRLPQDNWNGRFIELGCGGFCGSTEHISECDDPLRRGYACIVSDNGHKSTRRDAKWAYNNLQAEIDHAYRAAHVTALVGKAVVGRYYSRAPEKSYFSGCSTGGRQAMMEAQRFPGDFDGIIAGAPAINLPGLFMHLLWANRALTDDAGKPLLRQADLETLHNAVVAKCDLNDGVRDGLIGDPRVCDFDSSKLLCSRGKETECLTASQIAAVKKLYGGPVTSTGEQIYMPGPLLGSERTWLEYFTDSVSNPGILYNAIGDAFRYSALQPNPGATWKPKDFDFDHDSKRLGMSGSLYSPDNPDLRRFQRAGGKLLMFTGWNDAAGMPLPVVDYYETVEKTMGGRNATQDFFRLFVIPGMNHCSGGDGAFAVDWLTYLEAWVEEATAPDKLVSFHVNVDDDLLNKATQGDLKATRTLTRGPDFPLDPKSITFSRPVYPYPTAAKYLGHGDPKDAASFGPVTR